MAMATALCGSTLGLSSIRNTSLGAGIQGLRLSQTKAARSSLNVHALTAISEKVSIAVFTKEQVETGRNALAGYLIASLACSEAAMAAQPNATALLEIAQIADNDSRGLILLLVLAPAIGWVLFNILQPGLNQLNRMKTSKGLIGALGLSAAAISGSVFTPDAEALQEIATIADSDSRGSILLLVLAPAIVWVLYNILQPALNQINRMRQQK
ncbi:hypothetical protein O6H91_03G038100 [Diphasiastrum complanatum]|uniref:Uncharacterized protein n=4 Tax=Diphasiastrum complanatum TaxID=34168 RepID=A0ACC2E5F8_DIPCM|nr:hypothetical protein O6H91_03G038100 [Diphasiastrum complanatum]KAJ7561694.1 hypothetical protein O6H91_03G038100 [Diphasiastrum complanatum]KAJ7561695.1 hypothetical protein O6H91_03G038100 [Diphasiastrum complanatum]KAJ7561696.1 hypothetical protein O6H91_03G038100 [Diphasiastrum complanatum]